MKIATVLTPLSKTNLQLAAQLGVTDITLRYPGPELEILREQQKLVESFGLKVSAIEGYLPIENIKLGNADRDADIAELELLLRFMHEAGIKILCYNFMAGTDWVRTELDVPTRGGAQTTRFELAAAEKAVSLNQREGGEVQNCADNVSLTHDQLWANLEYFLQKIVPIAEELDVVLAMHPDDPPLEKFMGKARIMNSVENYERLLKLIQSPANAICFCQGTFAEMGVDIPATIRRLGSHIQYVHFRDIRGTRDDFTETFHDAGQTDMVEAMRAYREIGFNGPMRPDHVPQLVGEENGEPGYTMLGRLYAFGYMRGLMQATE